MKRALIVLDAQRVYTDPESDYFCKGASTTIGRINKLIESMSKRKEMVVLVRHVHKDDGSDIGHLFDFAGEPEDDFNFKEGTAEVEYDTALFRPKGVREIIKYRYLAFQRTVLDSMLHEAGIQKVVICGFMTNFCCESTAREALDRDYYVDFVTDATGTPGTDKFDQTEVRKIVAELLGAGFARIVTTKKFLSDQEI